MDTPPLIQDISYHAAFVIAVLNESYGAAFIYCGIILPWAIFISIVAAGIAWRLAW